MSAGICVDDECLQRSGDYGGEVLQSELSGRTGMLLSDVSFQDQPGKPHLILQDNQADLELKSGNLPASPVKVCWTVKGRRDSLLLAQ